MPKIKRILKAFLSQANSANVEQVGDAAMTKSSMKLEEFYLIK